MKKFIALVLAMSLLFSLTGCGDDSKNLSGIYANDTSEITFAKDGTFCIIDKNMLSKENGTYTVGDGTVTIINGSSATSYNFTKDDTSLILTAVGQSSGSVYTKTDKAPSTAYNLEKHDLSKLKGKFVRDLGNETYYAFDGEGNGRYSNAWLNLSSGFTYEVSDEVLNIYYENGNMNSFQFEIDDDSLIIYQSYGEIFTKTEDEAALESISVSDDLSSNLHYYVESGSGEVVVAGGTGAGYYWVSEDEKGWITPIGETAYVYGSVGLFDAIGIIDEGVVIAYYEVQEASNGTWYRIDTDWWVHGSEVGIVNK